MKKLLIFALCALLLLGGCAKEDDTPVALSTSTQSSLGILIEQAGMDEATAIDLLSQLRRIGHTGEIRMAFAQESGAYRLWLADATVDVAVNEDGFVRTLTVSGEVYDVAPQSGEAVDKSVETVENPGKSQENSGKSEENPQNEPTGEQSGAVENSLCLRSLTSPIKAGEKATLVAQGKAGEEYRISVRYASGESSAQGLEPQIAAKDGSLSWTFRVSARVAPGEYPVTVTGGGEQLDCTMIVEAKGE
jgi:hypothetical protein